MPMPSDELFDFYRAIDNNDVNTMSKMLAERFSVNNVDYVLDSPLNRAIASNAIKSMKYLIEAGADINDGVKGRPLEIALRWGTLEAVKILLENGVDVYQKDESGETYLDAAAISDDPGKLNVIIPYFKDNINVEDNRGNTAIMYAAAENADISIKYLSRHGANLNKINSDNISPLMVAATTRSEEAAETLLELGADPAYVEIEKSPEIPFMPVEAWVAIRPHFPDINKKYKFQFLRTLNERRYMDIILQMLLDLHSGKNAVDKKRLLCFLGADREEYERFMIFYGKLTSKNRLIRIMNILKDLPEYREIDQQDMVSLDTILREEEDKSTD